MARGNTKIFYLMSITQLELVTQVCRENPIKEGSNKPCVEQLCLPTNHKSNKSLKAAFHFYTFDRILYKRNYVHTNLDIELGMDIIMLFLENNPKRG